MVRSIFSTFCIAMLGCAALGAGPASASSGDRLGASAGAAPSDLSAVHVNSFAPPQRWLAPAEGAAGLLGVTNAYAWNSQNSGYFTSFNVAVPESLLSISTPSPTTAFVGAVEYIGDSVFILNIMNEFWELDPGDGAIIDSGSLTPPTGSQTWSGLARDSTTGTVYASATNVTNSSLYIVDFALGTSTLVGAVTHSPGLIAVAVDGLGRLWGYDIITDEFLSIDKTTGAGTVVGPLGFDANYGQGMAWDQRTDTIYLTAFNDNTFRSELRTVDRVTGASTFVGVLGSTTPGGTNQLGGVGIEPAGDMIFFDGFE